MIKSTMKKEQILAILEAHKSEMRKKFGVKKIGIFGSAISGRMTNRSDIDIAVEIESEYKTLHNYMELDRYLSRMFKVKVDLGIESAIKPIVKKAIERGIVYV